MSLIARIQYVNYLTYSNPGSDNRKPALRTVEFSPIKYSTAINITNGKGKTNMVTALLYLLSRDRKLKEIALGLFTPRRFGAPSHIRVQLWDIRDDMVQKQFGLDDGPLDPAAIPYNNDHFVFGLCAYRNEEPKFYHYRGILEDCPVFQKTDTGLIYLKEGEVEQSVRAVNKGGWNVSNIEDWRSFVESHIPRRVLEQQVKFHLDGGGDKSAQIHSIQQIGDESFGQAFFRTVIAPELLAASEEQQEGEDGQIRETFSEVLRDNFSRMAKTVLENEKDKARIEAWETGAQKLSDLIGLGERAAKAENEYQEMLSGVAADAALVNHLVATDPFPGLLDGRKLPDGKAGEIAPYLVVDKLYGPMILDAGIEKLTQVETGTLNRYADRERIQKTEVESSQVIDFACHIKIGSAPGWGGDRKPRKAYTQENALKLIPLLGNIGTAKIAGTKDVLMQAFGWLESVADTNIYRREHNRVLAEIVEAEKTIREGEKQIGEWGKAISELDALIKKYDQAKGAYEDLKSSGLFTAIELEAPGELIEVVGRELQDAEHKLNTHDARVNVWKQTHEDYLLFCKENPGISPKDFLASLECALQDARDQKANALNAQATAKAELEDLRTQQLENQQKAEAAGTEAEMLAGLAKHEPLYRQYFEDAAPDSIDIPGRINQHKAAGETLAKRRANQEKIRDSFDRLLPSVGDYQNAYGDIAPAELGDPVKQFADMQAEEDGLKKAQPLLRLRIRGLEEFKQANPDETPHDWLKKAETRRGELSVQIAGKDKELEDLERRRRELLQDPIARPNEIARAHDILVREEVIFKTLHQVIQETCSGGSVQEAWLSQFSALLFSPVIDNFEDAELAALKLNDGKAQVPVFLLEPLRSVLMDSNAIPKLEGELAYTWIAGLKTRAVECLVNPQKVEEERKEVMNAIERVTGERTGLQESLNEISGSSPKVVLARQAANALDDDAVGTLSKNVERVAELADLLKVTEQRAQAAWTIQPMKEYLALVEKMGGDAYQRSIIELEAIAKDEEQHNTEGVWLADCNTDTVRDAVNAMREYLKRGGKAKEEELSGLISSLAGDLATLGNAVAHGEEDLQDKEKSVKEADEDERSKELALAESGSHIGKLAMYAESKDLSFMNEHAIIRPGLQDAKANAMARSRMESQFQHAQRYVDNTKRDADEKPLLDRKGDLEQNISTTRESMDGARGALQELQAAKTLTGQFRDALHDSATRILAQYREIRGVAEDILKDGAPRFEHTPLYAKAAECVDEIRRNKSNPFVVDHIRPIGRMADELDLKQRGKALLEQKRRRDESAASYVNSKDMMCDQILADEIQGLTGMQATWLKESKEFGAPKELRTTLEEAIQEERKLLNTKTFMVENLKEKANEVLTMLSKRAKTAWQLLAETMASTPKARFFLDGGVVEDQTAIGGVLDSLYGEIEQNRRKGPDKHQRITELETINKKISEFLFSNIEVKFCHPSIWGGDVSVLTKDGLSEGMRSAIGLMWISKLAEFRVRQNIEQYGMSPRQNRAAMRKERYFMILDGLFSNLSDDDMIDAAMESLRESAGYFQLIGLNHHPRYVNNYSIFPAYFVGREMKSTSGSKHSWLTVKREFEDGSSEDRENTLGVFASYRLDKKNEVTASA